MTIQLTHLPHSFHSDYYTLALRQNFPTIAITMRSLTPYINTRQLPDTYGLLKQQLPSIFKTKCYNYSKWSFAKEVKATEVGHLFEHILLTNLCEIRRSQGIYTAVYRGETSWNWHREAYGTFHIALEMRMSDKTIFNLALTQSIKLLNLILSSTRSVPVRHA